MIALVITTGLIAIASALTAYRLEHHPKAKDGRTTEHKRTAKALTGLSIVAIVVACIGGVVEIRDQNSEVKDTKDQLRTIQGQLSTATNQLREFRLEKLADYGDTNAIEALRELRGRHIRQLLKLPDVELSKSLDTIENDVAEIATVITERQDASDEVAKVNARRFDNMWRPTVDAVVGHFQERLMTLSERGWKFELQPANTNNYLLSGPAGSGNQTLVYAGSKAAFIYLGVSGGVASTDPGEGGKASINVRSYFQSDKSTAPERAWQAMILLNANGEINFEGEFASTNSFRLSESQLPGDDFKMMLDQFFGAALKDFLVNLELVKRYKLPLVTAEPLR